MKIRLFFFLILLIAVNTGYSQLYQGPASGSVPSGVIVTTESFLDNSSGEPISPYVRRPLRNKIRFTPYPDEMISTPPKAPAGSNYINDPLAGKRNGTDAIDPFIFRSYQGFPDPGSYIPPDPYVAAGPTNIMGTDNGRFRIWNKEGLLIKSVSADAWFSTALGGASAFDPKVIYDNFAKRWIMVWLDQTDNPPRGYFLISVSDDSIPSGTWYNWAIPSTVYGSTPNNSWGDYEGVGFDEQALYITSNQFVFGSSFQGSRIRIIPKSQLYANNAGQLTWNDLWDIREPQGFSRTFGIRPSQMQNTNSEYFLLCQSPNNTGTYVVLYKITNPLASPVMTAVNIPVTTYSSPPSANQLGGSTIPIEAGGFNFMSEPKFMNGFLWAVHSVRNPVFTQYSSINYYKINVSSNTAAEDVNMGADGFWHFYPALAVDKDQNIAIAYSRSGVTEYIGGYYTSRLSSDPPGTLSGSKLIQAGKANYVKDFGGGRNRWGDYTGIWLDPADKNNFWILTEYADSPANTWAAWVAGIRLVPFSGARIFSDKDTLNFGVRELSFPSDTLKLTISSLGQDTLSVSNIQLPGTQIQLLTAVSYPIKLGFNQTKELKFRYLPTTAGNVYDSITIVNNDILNPQKRIIVKAKGFFINPAAAGTIYGITGAQSNGSFITLNKNTGAGTLIGLSGYSDITGISIRPSDNILFGVSAGSPSSSLLRINSSQGDAYPSFIIPLPSIRAIAFDTNNDLFCGAQTGDLYRYKIQTNETLFIGNTGIANLYSLSINPINGQLWGLALNNKIYKINKVNGSSVQVGIPGFALTPSITFSYQGKLYGTSGLGVQQCNLLQYDTTTGTATQIGSTGFQAINAIAISQQTVGIQTISTEIPKSFKVYQNFPNPFNPTTNIQFDIVKASKVRLEIFDISGRSITTLINSKLEAGKYQITFNASGLSSGVYFYRITADEFSDVKRMLLIK